MTTSIISSADAKEEFVDLVTRVSHHKERIVITRRGKEIVALVPIEDLRLIEETQDKKDLQDAVLSLKQIREEGALTLQQLKQSLD